MLPDRWSFSWETPGKARNPNAIDRMTSPILYIKSGCPWCQEAEIFFQKHGVALEIRDVNRDAEAMNRMVEVSGQTLTPTFEYEDFVVADFSVDEFLAALREVPEVQAALGLGANEE